MTTISRVACAGAAARLAATLAACCAPPAWSQDVPVRTLELRPGKGNPRNSEGAFVTLKDGRILFVYSHYTAGTGGDHDPAHLAGRVSSDGGRTWTKEDRLIVANEGGMNVMSVSLLRLQSGEIALFYLLKNSEEDCRPVMRLSTDEAETWGAPVACITDEVGYYVLNNDRVIQLKGGRLLAPVAQHNIKGSEKPLDYAGTVMCYLSDDGGKTWRRGKTAQKLYDVKGARVTAQEPGVVELKDGRVMMFIRTYSGCQYQAFSADGGDTWSKAEASSIASQISAASIKRLPSTGDLLLVWNERTPLSVSRGLWWRVPLTTAISRDDGKTWRHVKALEGNPKGSYCYVAIEPAGDKVLLGYCAVGTRITAVPVAWLYAEGPAPMTVSRQRADCFEGAPAGAFERLETPAGVWSAAAGHAEVFSYARGKGVRLLGGTDRTVTVTLPQPVACRSLKWGVERFASSAPYALVLEAKEGDAWRKVWEQGAGTAVGTHYPVACAAKENLQASLFRFRCTSTLGAIIVDMPDVSINGFFND